MIDYLVCEHINNENNNVEYKCVDSIYILFLALLVDICSNVRLEDLQFKNYFNFFT